MPSWRQVLEGVARAWTEQREEVEAAAAQTVPRLAGAAALEAPERGARPGRARRGGRRAAARLRRRATAAGAARPSSRRRPRSSSCSAAARPRWRCTRCGAMALGGMYDQIGGGFSRYSVDARWIVPHFEKMLYDNALLARAYLHGWQVTGEPLFRRVATETLDWALRELRQEEGGFASALDADSEGVEGRFYVWRPAQVREVLGDELGLAAIEHFGITEAGNFEGASIPVVARPGAARRSGEIKARLLGGARAAGAPRARRQAADRLERADDLRARRRGRGARARRLPGRRARVPRSSCCATCATTDGPAAAHLQPRAGQAGGLPGGPRVPARGAADALRGDVRGALVRGGAGARRAADRPLRRPRARRLLRRRRRPRAADRPPQGARGPADPGGRERRRVRAAAARRAHRRGPLRGCRDGRDPAAAHARAQAPGGVRAPAAGDRLPPRAGQGGRARRAGSGAARAGRAGGASARTSWWPAAKMAPSRCWPAGSRWTAARRPMCASTSRACAP